MIISIDAEKAFDKNPTSFHDKNTENCAYKRTSSTWLGEFIKKKPTGNITLHGERLKAFPLKSGTLQECPFSPWLFYTVLKVLAKATKQEK